MPPKNLGKHSHFVFWEVFFQTKWCYSPKIKCFAPLIFWPTQNFWAGYGTAWSEEAVNSIDFLHSNRKTWTTLNKHAGRSGHSSLLFPVSANSVASQLMMNGAHESVLLRPGRTLLQENFDLTIIFVQHDLWSVEQIHADQYKALACCI